MTIMRQLLNGLSALSLLLLLSGLLLWGRSYFAADMFTAQSGGVQRLWSSDNGRIHFGLFTISPDNGYNHPWTYNGNTGPGNTGPVAGGTFWQHQRFGVGWDVRGSLAFTLRGVRYRQSAREWWIAYWLVVLLALPLATIVLQRITRWMALCARRTVERRRQRARGFPLEELPAPSRSG